MYEKNGIVYGDNACEMIKVVNVKPLDDMMLLLTFNDTTLRLYDCTQLLSKPVFSSLLNDAIFKNPKIVNGVVTWDNEAIDIAPETMYANSYFYNQNDILVA